MDEIKNLKAEAFDLMSQRGEIQLFLREIENKILAKVNEINAKVAALTPPEPE
jgi:hypothetical protein